MNILYDSLDIEYKNCGCAISSNLDIIENIIKSREYNIENFNW